jgi:uncharacterized protein (TIGR02246 family)
MIEHALRQLTVALFAAALAGASSAAQTSDPAQNDIRTALLKWTTDFNARNVPEICDLFALDLRYDFAGQPERGYQDICDLLRRSLSDPGKRYSYSADIKEIIVTGDLAIVRLIWTLTVRTGGATEEVTSKETGMDVFRKQADGRWKIIRYIAYEAP